MIDFLQSLYPDAAGYLTIWTRQDEKTYWFPINNLESIATKAIELSNLKRDVYYGMGLANEIRKPTKTSRSPRTTASTVTAIPGLWFDFDIQSPTKKNVPANIQQVIEFLKNEPFLPTILVDSGHGLHGYWLFKEMWDLTDPNEHIKAADILSRFQKYMYNRAATHGWKFDKTHDLCRILRLPGTQNYKFDPVPVKTIHKSDLRYNPDDFDSFLPDSTDAEITTTIKKLFESRPTDGSAAHVIEKCIFIQHCRDHAENLPEPYWYAMLTNISRCNDGLEACHELSKKYSKYSISETSKKYAQARNNPAPQSCEYIRNTLNFTGCPEGGCGIKNPVTWALSPAKRKKQSNSAPTETTEFIGMEKLTDLGNAERLIRLFGKDIKFCKDIGGWLLWDGSRWKNDTTGQIISLAKKSVRKFYVEASEIADSDIRKAVLSHAKRSESLQRISAMVTLAQHMVAIEPQVLDDDYWLLNCKNGVIDLKTGQLLPHDSSRNITKMAPVAFDPDAKCPAFEKFISEVFDKNDNLIRFMQRFLGYSLTGDTREQVFAVAHGAQGSNGKGTLLNLVHDILGDYAKTIQTESLLTKKNEGPSNDIAALRGARYVTASEIPPGRRMNEALIKQLTGQDTVSARFLNREFFEFLPQFKIVILANEKPTASGDDDALWRRVMLVPFTQRFTGENKNVHLRETLRAKKEVQGVLKWLVNGCLEWQKNGLMPPEEVVQATQNYHEDMDIIQRWIHDSCFIDKINFKKREKTSILYQNFMIYVQNMGEKAFFSQTKFSQSLVKKGFEPYRNSSGRYILGLSLLDQTHIDQGFSQDFRQNPF